MVNPCDLCTAKCCKDYLITVTSFDALRIIQNTNKKPEEFVQLSTPPILNADEETILECYEGKFRSDFVLAFKSHPCTFLDEKNRCTIYKFAPLGCKLYPYNEQKNLIKRSICPLPSKILFHLNNSRDFADIYSKQLSDYKNLVSTWNKSHGKKEDCISFLLTETQKYFKL